MKLLVFSDSHGSRDRMPEVAAQESPDVIFHLGDGWRDAEALHARYPEIPLYQVPGNCDFRSQAEPELLVTIQGKRILLCHGHTYGVKDSLMMAGEAADRLELDAFLFGHTHRPLVSRRGKTLFLNPGSIGDFHPFYGVLTLRDGRLDGRTAKYPGTR